MKDSPETPEGIARSYTADILWRRWLGWWIDSLICLGAGVGLIYGFKDEHSQISIPILIAGVFLYFWIPEGLRGLTIGKWAARLRVMDAHGNVPGLPKAFIRTLARLVEAIPLTPLPFIGGLVIGVSKTHQRIGDQLADTFVLRARDLARLERPG